MSEFDQPGGATSQIPTQMTTTVGQLDNFDPNEKHRECYFEIFEQFTIINNIAPERQVACLLAVWRSTKPCLPGKAQRLVSC